MLIDIFAKVFTLNILKSNIGDPVLRTVKIDLGNMFMIKAGCQSRLVRETLGRGGIPGLMTMKDLDGYPTIKKGIPRFINAPHSPLPDESGNLEMPEFCADFKNFVLWQRMRGNDSIGCSQLRGIVQRNAVKRLSGTSGLFGIDRPVLDDRLIAHEKRISTNTVPVQRRSPASRQPSGRGLSSILRLSKDSGKLSGFGMGAVRHNLRNRQLFRRAAFHNDFKNLLRHFGTDAGSMSFIGRENG